MRNIENHIVYANATLKDCLEQLNKILDASLTLFVLNDDKEVIGTVTDGDTRRAFLNGKTIDASVTEVMFKDFSFLRKGLFNIEEVKNLREAQINAAPVLDAENKIDRIIDFINIRSCVPADAVIMAGGKGTRLRPLTDDLPKPLLKVGDKPILEHNLDRLRKFGIEKVNVSVNYLAEKIENFFGDGSSRQLTIDYLHEDKPLGTIGALTKIKEIQNDYVLVMNSDLLTTIDFEDFFHSFVNSGAEMAVATTSYEIKVPYAILETENGSITSLKEKPTYSHFSNAGIYLLKKEVIELIPSGEFFNATDLIELLIKQEKTVTYYPILGYWLDIGKHEDYNKAQKDIRHLNILE